MYMPQDGSTRDLERQIDNCYNELNDFERRIMQTNNEHERVYCMDEITRLNRAIDHLEYRLFAREQLGIDDD